MRDSLQAGAGPGPVPARLGGAQILPRRARGRPPAAPRRPSESGSSRRRPVGLPTPPAARRSRRPPLLGRHCSPPESSWRRLPFGVFRRPRGVQHRPAWPGPRDPRSSRRILPPDWLGQSGDGHRGTLPPRDTPSPPASIPDDYVAGPIGRDGVCRAPALLRGHPRPRLPDRESGVDEATPGRRLLLRITTLDSAPSAPMVARTRNARAQKRA